MSSMLHSKITLRKELIQRLSSLTAEDILRQSKAIQEKIIRSKIFQRSTVIAVYLSMEKEVQTTGLLTQLFSQHKECFMPRFQPGSSEMEMIRLHSMDDFNSLPVNKWNIRQAANDELRESVFERGHLDLVLVPGLGFTAEGKRLGRGKGYYDKFLHKCSTSLASAPFTIGLAFNEQILPDIPVADHDVCLGSVIYENS